MIIFWLIVPFSLICLSVALSRPKEPWCITLEKLKPKLKTEGEKQ